jgi:diaminohydroxyphosphoribosylaminopyrimidine deaminase/5-amino-6-(5-phosphoribosylamino)uracil reductase
LRARIARVVVGVRDPNPRVDGGGIAILRASGLDVSEGVLKEACRRFHAPFFRLIRTGLPWVVLKLALDASGSAGPSGERTQITPAEIQSLAHALRRASGAIIVGRCTVEVDDPLLTDRWPEPVPPHRSFLRVVLDSQGRLGKGRRIWRPVEGQPTLRATVEELPPLRDVEDLRLPPGPGGCSLRHLLHELAAKGVDRVLVEGGPKLARAFLDQDLVDEFHCFRGLGDTGGTPLRLDLSHLGKVRFESNLSKGSWRILARPDLA